jgi:hypothetical protein
MEGNANESGFYEEIMDANANANDDGGKWQHPN